MQSHRRKIIGKINVSLFHGTKYLIQNFIHTHSSESSNVNSIEKQGSSRSRRLKMGGAALIAFEAAVFFPPITSSAELEYRTSVLLVRKTSSEDEGGGSISRVGANVTRFGDTPGDSGSKWKAAFLDLRGETEVVGCFEDDDLVLSSPFCCWMSWPKPWGSVCVRSVVGMALIGVETKLCK